jgi:hypothetical protein
MYAIEFETELKNGLIKVPAVYQTDLAGPIKVIILKNQSDQVAPPTTAAPTTIAWPDEILVFQGVSDLPPFESYRDELLSLQDDPLA